MLSRAISAAPDAAYSATQSLRQCLGHFATGVAVVTYPTEGGPRGVTVNSFTSVSLDPPLVLICLKRGTRSAAHIQRSSFVVNVLNHRQRDLAKQFAGHRLDDELPLTWQWQDGIPRLAENIAWLSCDPWSEHEAGDHVIVIGKVTAFETNAEHPLCFFRGNFLELNPNGSQVGGANRVLKDAEK